MVNIDTALLILENEEQKRIKKLEKAEKATGLTTTTRILKKEVVEIQNALNLLRDEEE